MLQRLKSPAVLTALRYLLIAAVAVDFAWRTYEQTKFNDNDFVALLVGAYTLNHHQGPIVQFDEPRFNLYVDHPHIQIGPPALVFVALLGGLTALRIKMVVTVVTALLAVVAIAGSDLAARRREVDRSSPLEQGVMLLAALGVAAWWSEIFVRQAHFDDPIVLVLVAMAVASLARDDSKGWVAAICLGVAAATKPWAVIFTPLLLVLPRVRRAPAVLACIGSAAVWWAPFVIAAPKTIASLGHFQVFSAPGSVMRLLGLEGEVQRWIRPTQFLLGCLACAVVVMYGRWTAAPLAAVAMRVLTDPMSWAYYGIGPLLFAYLWDATRPTTRRFPVWTAATGVLVFVLPRYFGATTIAVGKLVWCLAVLTLIVAPAVRAALQSRRAALPAPAAAS